LASGPGRLLAGGGAFDMCAEAGLQQIRGNPLA
jgi:hypothetical protein